MLRLFRQIQGHVVDAVLIDSRRTVRNGDYPIKLRELPFPPAQLQTPLNNGIRATSDEQDALTFIQPTSLSTYFFFLWEGGVQRVSLTESGHAPGDIHRVLWGVMLLYYTRFWLVTADRERR